MPYSLAKEIKRLGHVFMFKRNHQAAHFLRRLEGIGDLALDRGINLQCRLAGRANVDRIPLRIQLCGKAGGLSERAAQDQVLGC